MDYYLVWDCPTCDATNYEGINRTYLTHPDNRLPVIPMDVATALSLTCSDPDCGAECYTPGDFELMTDV